MIIVIQEGQQVVIIGFLLVSDVVLTLTGVLDTVVRKVEIVSESIYSSSSKVETMET